MVKIKVNEDISSLCPFCKLKEEGKDVNNEAFLETQLYHKCIYLHSYKYSVFISLIV